MQRLACLGRSIRIEWTTIGGGGSVLPQCCRVSGRLILYPSPSCSTRTDHANFTEFCQSQERRIPISCIEIDTLESNKKWGILRTADSRNTEARLSGGSREGYLGNVTTEGKLFSGPPILTVVAASP